MLPNTSCAVSRRLGSGSSIFFTRSFALSETLGHGSLLKSTTDRMIACATPCSVSSFYKMSKRDDLENETNQIQKATNNNKKK